MSDSTLQKYQVRSGSSPFILAVLERGLAHHNNGIYCIISGVYRFMVRKRYGNKFLIIKRYHKEYMSSIVLIEMVEFVIIC